MIDTFLLPVDHPAAFADVLVVVLGHKGEPVADVAIRASLRDPEGFERAALLFSDEDGCALWSWPPVRPEPGSRATLSVTTIDERVAELHLER